MQKWEKPFRNESGVERKRGDTKTKCEQRGFSGWRAASEYASKEE